MRKLNILMNETTIIDFPYFWKLMKRYKIVSIFVPMIVLSLSVFQYMAQNDIYQVVLGFKNNAGDSTSATASLLKAIGESSENLDPSEIVSLGNSTDFQVVLADFIHREKDLKKFNFNNINLKKDETAKDYIGVCNGNEKCEKNAIRKHIGRLYSIREDTQVYKRFIVNVRSLDRTTSKVVANNISKAIADYRITTTRHFLKEQIKVSNALITNKEKELSGYNISKIEQVKSFLTVELKDLERKIVSVQSDLYKKKNTVARLSERSKQTGNELSRKTTGRAIAQTRKAIALEADISQMQEDLGSLELSQRHFGEKDGRILKELRKELKLKVKELETFSSADRTLSGVADFIKNKNKSFVEDKLDLKIIKAGLSKTEKHHQELLVKREEVLIALGKIKAKLEGYQPLIGYINILKEKKIKLTIAEQSVVSDLTFDNSFTSTRRYKKVSKGKLFLVYFLLSIGVLFLAVILRYLLDGRIYDEFELTKNFKDLEIIGNTPDFR